MSWRSALCKHLWLTCCSERSDRRGSARCSVENAKRGEDQDGWYAGDARRRMLFVVREVKVAGPVCLQVKKI